ncbi:Yip1 family protein [Kitasatospora cinereorecta]|uniref:Yip1 family protein n=1 Tax=Kitasatospora cinereorecta TaxID=285560 RepID=A0ABW0VCE8_9ACTN
MAGNRHDNGQGADPRQSWAASGGPAPQHGGPTGQPEYFTAPIPGVPTGGPGDQPGHTRAFAVGQEPYGPQDPYGRPQGGYPGSPGPEGYDQGGYGPEGGYGPDGYGPGGYDQGAYPQGGYDGQDGYDAQGGYGGQGGYDGGYPGEDNVATYRAGGQSAPHQSGPRLPWRALLAGMYREPSRTFDRMRDHQVWLPALCVSLLYGVLAVFGMGSTRNDVVDSTFSVALWAIVAAAITFSVAGAMLGAVTHGLARQLGGDGPWQSTVGLAILISWTTDAPRLLLALFLPASNPVVQIVGWATWLVCGALLTTMVRRIHDLPWGKALGAASVQLLALLVLIKLPTLG